MSVTHTSIMKVAQRLARAENLLELESAECCFNKFVRTFASLTEALKRNRTVSEQNVTVQNLSVRDGGQALAVNVTQNTPAVQTDKSAVSCGDHQRARAPDGNHRQPGTGGHSGKAQVMSGHHPRNTGPMLMSLSPGVGAARFPPATDRGSPCLDLD